jgi:hypothetical protein
LELRMRWVDLFQFMARVGPLSDPICLLRRADLASVTPLPGAETKN